jgi:hypothetical protein
MGDTPSHKDVFHWSSSTPLNQAILLQKTACRFQTADSRPDSGGTGSQQFETNIWMWRYGRTFLIDSLWSMSKRGCRKPGHEELRLFGAGM